MTTRRISTILAVCLLAATFVRSASAQSSINVVPPQPLITTTGTADVEAVPDQAIVRIGIVRQGGTAREAQEDASKIAQAILKAIAALGVPAPRIQTSRLTITPVYAQQRPGNGGIIEAPRISAYNASNTLTVTLDNLALIGPVVDAGLDNSANQLEGVQFRLKNDGPVREQALKLAVAEAKGKAVAMAEALGVTLGPVQEVSESGTSVIPFEERGEATFAMAARVANPTPVSVGQLQVRGSVVLKFSIVSKN